MAQITKEDIAFASADGSTTIRGNIWRDEQAQPAGIVQLVHGMAEYIGRYDAFARFLAENGYIVCGHDHLGHGASINSKEDWGHFPIKNGIDVLIGDVHTLRRKVQEQFGGELPYFVFGHSMGSFVVRAYAARHASGLAGAIICGTGTLPVGTSKAGNTLCHLLGKMRGQRYRSKLVDGMGAGGYGKLIKDAETPLDWLSYDKENVARYIADERCGFMFTVGGYAAVTGLTAEVCSPECVAKYPKTLPLLYIAGEGDPVGDFGEGVKKACKLAVDGGLTDVGLKIYPNMRHEILNEAGKQEVYTDVLEWLNARI